MMWCHEDEIGRREMWEGEEKMVDVEEMGIGSVREIAGGSNRCGRLRRDVDTVELKGGVGQRCV